MGAKINPRFQLVDLDARDKRSAREAGPGPGREPDEIHAARRINENS
jgi:hypothetical protein